MFALDMLAQVDAPAHDKTVMDSDNVYVYNCIGWAKGVMRWLWCEYFYDSVEDFVSYWTKDDWRVVEAGEAFDPTQTYNVLMAKRGEATHAIRYDPTNGWTSKEGASALYKGNCPQALYSTRHYGQPVAIVVKV